MQQTPISTENLTIRRLGLSDAAFILELLNTASWQRFIGNRDVYNETDAEQYIINGPFSSFKTYGYGPYAVVLRETDQLIGICGLYKRPHLDYPDLGFAFLPDAEGKGYAFESCRAIIQHVSSTKGIHKLLALTDPQNIRSISLLERCGFSNEGLSTYNKQPSLLFSKDLNNH